LVVDDDAESRELLNNILSERGAVVTLARSADEALQILSANNMDLLVGDIGMPEKDGYDLMREIRASTSEDIRSLKAIALTQFAHAEDSARAEAAGFQKHITKPVEPSELVAIVASTVRTSRHVSRDPYP